MTEKSSRLSKPLKYTIFVVLLIVLIALIFYISDVLGPEYAIFITISLVIFHIFVFAFTFYKLYQRRKETET